MKRIFQISSSREILRLGFLYLLLIGLLATSIPAFAQNLQVNIPDQTVEEDDLVDVEITIANFNEMVSVQFSLNWDPSVIEYVAHEEMDLESIAIGTVGSAAGDLRFSWFYLENIGGETLADGEGIAKIQFRAIGENGDSTGLLITETPVDIQFFQDVGMDSIFTPLVVDINQGSVKIGTGQTNQNQVSVAASIDDIACFGDTQGAIDILLIGDGNYTFDWQGPNGFTSNTPDIEELIAGNYSLQVLDEDGLSVLDTNFIVAQPIAELSIQNIVTNATDCNETNGFATISPIGGTAPYTYDIGNGASNDSTIEGLAAGNYQVTITDANQCEIFSVFSIEAPSSFSVNLGEDLVLCEGEAAFLESGNEGTYQWSTGSTEAAISVSTTGTYSLTVTDASNCTSVDTISVEVTDDVNLTVQNDTLSVCPGDSIQLQVSGAQVYEWQGATETLSATTTSNPTATPNETTMYNLIGTSECGEDTLQVEVKVYEITATAGQDTCVAAGTELELNASGGAFYYWIGGDYPLSNYNIPNPRTTPEDSTEYRIMIVDENECTTFDAVKVFVGSDPSLFVPKINLITPNGDGKNDVLEFGTLDKYGPNSIKVFNRWGNTVYDRINYQSDDERFDGTFKGKPLPAGTYYYVLSFRDDHIKQTLAIVRD